VPLSLHYLEEIMRQAKNIERNEILSRAMVIELLQAKIQKVDWENAKADVRVFIVDSERLEIWSARFFLDLVE